MSLNINKMNFLYTCFFGNGGLIDVKKKDTRLLKSWRRTRSSRYLCIFFNRQNLPFWRVLISSYIEEKTRTYFAPWAGHCCRWEVGKVKGNLVCMCTQRLIISWAKSAEQLKYARFISFPTLSTTYYDKPCVKCASVSGRPRQTILSK